MKALADKYGEDIQLLQMPEKAVGKRSSPAIWCRRCGQGAGAAGAEGGEGDSAGGV
jgi:hypothetical protein